MSEKLLKEIIESQQFIIKTLHHHSVQLDDLQKGQLRVETRLESEVADKIGGLYDFREAQNNVNNKVLAALERIENKIESHDIQIRILDKTKSNKRSAK